MVISKRPIKHFISEPIQVHHSTPPSHLKKPPCPDGFTWQNETFTVSACLAHWVDFARHGRMAKNMQAQHAQVASQRGSWGVGKFFFDVRVEDNRCYRIYYDRAPTDAADRAGTWILLAELTEPED